MRKLILLLTLLAVVFVPGCEKAYSTGSGEKKAGEQPAQNAPTEAQAESAKPVLSPAREELIKLMKEEGFYLFEQLTQKYEDFELKNLDGKTTKLSHYNGQVIFLNFWATWCGPCRQEMPSMQKLYDELKDEGFVIVAINLQEDAAAVKKFMKALDLNFPVLLDETGTIGGMYGASSIPTTYIFDKNGYVVAGTLGTREWDTQETKNIFRMLLEEEA